MTTAAPYARLVGRDRAVAEILRTIESSAAPLVLVTGPAGIGRTAVLDAVAAAVEERGRRTVRVRAPSEERSQPAELTLRLASELGALGKTGRPADEARANGAASRRRHLAGLIAGADLAPVVASRAATMMATAVLGHGNVVAVLDDLQWIDLDSLAVLEPLLRQLSGTSVTCVAGLRRPAFSGAPAGGEIVVDRLVREGLATVVPLHTLDSAEVTAVAAAGLQARPTESLVAELVRVSAGIPGALVAAVDGYRAADAIRITDRHAYLVRGNTSPMLPERHPLFAPIHRLGPLAWSVAKAAAALHPLGPAVTALIGEAVGIGEHETRRVLHLLRAEGVLAYGRPTGTWRFPVPVLAAALTGRLGPYERRQLARIAVTAVWDGTAGCDDPDYVADQVAAAGRLVDPERAGAQLLTRAAENLLHDGHRAATWLRAAADLTTDRVRRAGVLFLHAAACCIHGDFAAGARSSTALLRDHPTDLPASMHQELQMIHVVALRGIGDTAALERIVSAPDGVPEHLVVTRAAALGLLDRWRDAHELLSATRSEWTTDDVSADLGQIFLSGSALWLGRPELFEKGLVTPNQWRLNHVDRHHLERVVSQARLLLVLGESGRAEGLLTEEGVPVEQLPLSDRSVLSSLRGHWKVALDQARQSIASGTALGYEPGHVVMHEWAATMLLAAGQPARARALLTAAQTAAPTMTHLLDAPAAALDRLLGAPEQARRRLTAGLRAASERGVVIGTESLLRQLADLAVERGDTGTARGHLAQLDRVAEAVGSGRPTLLALLVRATLDRDGGAAAEALRLARERDQPFELAATIHGLVRRGLAAPALLGEAYELLGGLGALLHRAWLRNLMREHDIVVPGRQETVVENQLLLAGLVTEGLSNRQLAAVLQASEKSVEGRLSRLFTRTGYRSRVELAAAMLTGEYSG